MIGLGTILLVGCLQGPTGPVGPQGATGPKGDSSTVPEDYFALIGKLGRRATPIYSDSEPSIGLHTYYYGQDSALLNQRVIGLRPEQANTGDAIISCSTPYELPPGVIVPADSSFIGQYHLSDSAGSDGWHITSILVEWQAQRNPPDSTCSYSIYFQ